MLLINTFLGVQRASVAYNVLRACPCQNYVVDIVRLFFYFSLLDILTKLRRYQGKHKLLALWFGHDLNIFLYSPEFAEIFCQSSKLLHRSSKAKLFEAIAPNGAILSSGIVLLYYAMLRTIYNFFPFLGAKWKKARKLMESALHYSAIKNFIPIIESETDILIQRLRGEVGNPKFPLVPYLKPLLFDIISGQL